MKFKGPAGQEGHEGPRQGQEVRAGTARKEQGEDTLYPVCTCVCSRLFLVRKKKSVLLFRTHKYMPFLGPP